MLWLGMCALGVFMGSVITYGLRKIDDWKKPGNVFTSVVGAAVAGGVFTFIKYLGGDTHPEAVAMYPVGLAYGMLCINLQWLTETDEEGGFFIGLIKLAHGIAWLGATALLLGLFFCPTFRQMLPT
jgi:hypothetical protein